MKSIDRRNIALILNLFAFSVMAIFAKVSVTNNTDVFIQAVFATVITCFVVTGSFLLSMHRGYWGVPNGPYLVLPLFGPSTLRDGASLPIDFAVSPTQFVNDIPTRNQVFTLRLVSKRAELLKSGNMLEQASIDKYSFTRDAYLQYRRSQIYDGNPPDEEDSNDDPSANPVPVK